MLAAVEIRGPGSAVIVPNGASPSQTAWEDAYDARDAGLAGDCSAENDFDLEDLGEVGALAMRTIGAAAASSGCKNGLSADSSGDFDAP